MLAATRNISTTILRTQTPTLFRCMSTVVTISDSHPLEKFRTVNTKSILYFTASWCPPCKMIAPIYTKLAKEYPEVAFAKVDVDDNSDAALNFEISSVPTFVLFNKDEAFGRFSGADQGQLESLIQDLKDA